jgi:ABC-type proline/glycine betaine transport system permease subunit
LGRVAKACEHLRLTVACLVLATAVGIALTIG